MIDNLEWHQAGGAAGAFVFVWHAVKSALDFFKKDREEKAIDKLEGKIENLTEKIDEIRGMIASQSGDYRELKTRVEFLEAKVHKPI